ncbi:hypothetical protein EKO29_13065 [Colwellia sp. Arc7-635]|uniref:hypothetical protein n=1 Tax=Colwellia sp. Arc7-635 TaxID=2497879 RepID=UPI000F84F202|nr:hypothetical protein [Colwellia sp. Arc7-635]AZQ84841.1 hypothetical protein EKO29_13065 [Colwellia sp. Arc7-635]
MKNIIAKITSSINKSISENIQDIFSVSGQHNDVITHQQVECNYANDYYGDQQCQLKKVK